MMRKWLFEEAKNPTIVTKIIDLMGLNLIFIISCIPLLTIGASLTALYSVTFKMADPDKDHFLVRDYIDSFKKNFRQSTTAMGIILLKVALLVGIIFFINHAAGDSEPSLLITAPFLLVVTIIGLVTLYLFPLVAYFENSTRQVFKNALIISFHQMAKSIVLFLIALIIIVVIPLFVQQLWFVWLLMAFSLTAYLQSLILRKIFISYTEKDEKSKKEKVKA